MLLSKQMFDENEHVMLQISDKNLQLLQSTKTLMIMRFLYYYSSGNQNAKGHGKVQPHDIAYTVYDR